MIIQEIAPRPGPVVIVGVRPATMPWVWTVHRQGGEVWMINDPTPRKDVPQWDRLLQIHGLAHLRERHGDAFLDTLRAIRPPKRVMVPGAFLDELAAPAAEAFPHDDVVALTDCAPRPFFTNSFAWAIGLALLEGRPAIYLDGIDLTIRESWAIESISFWLGFAAGRQVRVEVPEGVGLFSYGAWGKDYGFEGEGSR